MIISKTDKNLFTINGANFSGRSDFLKSLCSIDSIKPELKTKIYVGEQPSNYISGLFPLVENEIDFYLNSKKVNNYKTFTDIIEYFNFTKYYKRNPFTLSGGEQAILVILTSLFLTPDILALDSITEQLDVKWRNILFTKVFNKENVNGRIYLADNRIDEYNFVENTIDQINSLSKDFKTLFIKHKNTLQLPTDLKPVRIKLDKLSFSYYKNDCILDDLTYLLEPGNIYILKGNNGSGKSTFAKILTGILNCNKGLIFADDNIHNTYKYPGKLFGYSHQSPDEQLFSKTVDNEILKETKKSDSLSLHRKNLILDSFGFDNLKTLHPAELPFIVRKRISLASTLAFDRPWYIFDEPTLGQDIQFVEFLCNIFVNLMKSGKGIIIISHSNVFNKYLKSTTLNLINGKVFANI